MPAKALYAGLGGVARNACVTLCTSDQVLGICEQERITRVRSAGFNDTGLPDEALDELLAREGRRRDEIGVYGVAMPAPPLKGLPATSLENHFALACAAFLASPFESATIVVCDQEPPGLSVWKGHGPTVSRLERAWHGPAFAELYSGCSEALGFSAAGREQRMEALARLTPSATDDRPEDLFDFDADHLVIADGWRSRVQQWVSQRPRQEMAPVAAALQSRIGDLLIRFLASVQEQDPSERLCVGGSLFHNSYFNTRVKCQGGFAEVFVPVNPGTPGLSVGAAMHVSGGGRRSVTPFLGPAYSSEDVKATLDNCKLTYQWSSEREMIAMTVDALLKGRLVAWFDGPMEWGARALGARSILANPFAPYVLDNLNQFLKQREEWRGYALSGLDRVVRECFDGPAASPFMECDYVAKDREQFRHILPGPDAAVRVQTVGDAALPRFRALLQAFGEATGTPILVNTSFNGFREPIVCSPRDALRVFFGTGIEVLMLNQFVISK